MEVDGPVQNDATLCKSSLPLGSMRVPALRLLRERPALNTALYFRKQILKDYVCLSSLGPHALMPPPDCSVLSSMLSAGKPGQTPGTSALLSEQTSRQRQMCGAFNHVEHQHANKTFWVSSAFHFEEGRRRGSICESSPCKHVGIGDGKVPCVGAGRRRNTTKQSHAIFARHLQFRLMIVIHVLLHTHPCYTHISVFSPWLRKEKGLVDVGEMMGLKKAADALDLEVPEGPPRNKKHPRFGFSQLLSGSNYFSIFFWWPH